MNQQNWLTITVSICFVKGFWRYCVKHSNLNDRKLLHVTYAMQFTNCLLFLETTFTHHEASRGELVNLQFGSPFNYKLHATCVQYASVSIYVSSRQYANTHYSSFLGYHKSQLHRINNPPDRFVWNVLACAIKTSCF